MAALELRFLGGLEVIRDGESLALPPSKKTRALLAYLALNRRTFRREHLCELFWEIPDDPRGSLRWSLSKLRRLVDDDERQRIIADRNTVGFDAADARIDLAALRAVADGALEQCSIEALEEAVRCYSGRPLEGLELPDFPEFDAWRIAERELAIGAQKRLLETLIWRLAHDPERALTHARTLVQIVPYEESARAALVRLLVALGRAAQADQEIEVGARILKEAGVTTLGELYRARRGMPEQARTESGTRFDRPSQTTRPVVSEPTATIEPLIGRDLEIGRIATTLSDVIARCSAAFVLVSGEPGIGKSRLLAAAADCAREAGAVLLQASAFESESIRPFALWIDALRKLSPDAEAAVFGTGGQGNRDRLFSGLADLIAGHARSQPVVVVFDDLQWSDESSAAALHYIARTHADQRLLGVLAARDDELRDNAPALRAVRDLRQAGLLEDVRLGPLAEDALRALIDARAQQVMSERLCRQCGGNPLLAIELARAEAAGDSGQSLGELVQERLARFDASGGEALRWAAVLAPQIDARMLARVTGMDWNRIGEALETAARQSMLLPVDGGFRFSHDLIARSIYESISPARRRTMHRRIAELLEQDTALDLERAADLAHHAAQSGDAALAARAMVSAGRLCLRFFANGDALALARKGLAWVEQLSNVQRVCLTLELREIMLAAAPIEDWEAAAREYAGLAEQALDLGALSHARRGYYMASYLHWMHGQWAGAREEILQSERVARGASDEEHIIGMAEAARCLAMLERDLTHADAMLMEAQALASRKGFSHQSIPAALGMLRFHENRLDEALELFKDARMLAKAGGDRLSEFQASEYLAMIEIECGRLEAAREHTAQLIQLGERLREGSERPLAHAFDALCHYTISDDAAPLEAALVELRAADAKHRLAYTLTRAALVDLERHRPAAAIERATEALAYAEALGRASETLLARAVLARACRDADDAPACTRHAAALAQFEVTPVAGWARKRAGELLGTSG